jgi:hypothetical protein
MWRRIMSWWKQRFGGEQAAVTEKTLARTDRKVEDARRVLEGYNAEIQAMTGRAHYGKR